MSIACLFVLMIGLESYAFQPHQSISRTKSHIISSSFNHDADATTANKIFFDIAIQSPTEEIELGRLTFHLTPPNHPHYLPLHISNFMSLASSQRKSIDPKATYEGCLFQYSPSTIEDGSMRYKWGHVCEGYGRNAIQTTSATGVQTSYDQPFSDPERMKECTHKSFGGVYYGQNYQEIVEKLASIDNGQDVTIMLTVPIQGPGAGTSRFSIVRVSESPQEWGERLLLNSAVIGWLDCGADGTFGGVADTKNAAEIDDNVPSSLDVLQAIARQKYGPPKIINSGGTIA